MAHLVCGDPTIADQAVSIVVRADVSILLLVLLSLLLVAAVLTMLFQRRRQRGLYEAERQLREKLAEDARRVRFLLDEAMDGIVLTDDGGAVVEANRSYARMLGYDLDVVRHLHIWDWDVRLDTREKYLAAYPRVLREPGQFEACFRRADGSLLDVEVAHSPVLWDGRWCSFSVCRDVTERKRAEAALRQSEHQFRLFTEIVPLHTWMTTPDGQAYYFNQYWYAYTGLTPEQSLGRGWIDALHPDDLRETATRWQAAVQAGEPFMVETRIRRHDGTYRWFLARALPARDPDGSIVRWLGTSSDVDDIKTEQSRLEASLASRTRDLVAARDQAETASRVKDIFLATMSHELRTPLNSIIGFSELMLAGIAGDLNEEQQRQLEIVRRSGHQLLGLISEVLDISKIETGQLVLEPEPLALAPILEEQRQAFEIQAADCGLALEVRLPDPGLVVLGDPKRVRQVLGNLLSNAIKYTDTGGVRLWTAREDGYVRVTVEDTGIGVAPEDLPHLFKPFYRAASGRTRQRDGTGLGLAVSRRLVLAMGGSIDAASEPGRGSRFTFTLPLAGAATD